MSKDNKNLKDIDKVLFSDTERVELWFAANWKKAAVCLTLLAAVVVAVVYFVSRNEQNNQSAAFALADITVEKSGVLNEHADHPTAIQARIKLASLYIEKKEYKKAADIFRKIIADPKADEVWKRQASFMLASTLEAAGDAKDAVAQYQKIVSVKTENLGSRVNAAVAAARLLVAANRKSEAVKMLENLLKEATPNTQEFFAPVRNKLLEINDGK